MSVQPKHPPQSNPLKINLFIQKGEKRQIEFQILLKWLFSTGRFIVIFVEIIVIGAFVYRYKLDAELTELQEQIKEQIPYIQGLKEDEILIRQTQFQLATIKQIKNGSPSYVTTFQKVATLTPQSIHITNISLDQTKSYPTISLSITGQTPSNLELSAFIKALKKDPDFSNIALTNIGFEGQTVFTITGNVVVKGGKSG